MGSKQAPAPAAAPALAPAAVTTPVADDVQSSEGRGVLRRPGDDTSAGAAAKASLLGNQTGNEIDPLSQKKQLTGGSAALLG